jgi:ATP-dependent helicase/nuclease subunit A
MSLTRAQQQAVAARGNVLVVAGAGTGKTSTLVERCLACLLDGKPPASLDEILMVTFTDAAAAEMRQRIRARLEEKMAGQADHLHWQEQLALFETAHIGTLHSFCLKLLRQHFYELELDPQLAVLPEEEARLLADETLDEILRKHYAGDTAFAPAVQQLIQSQGRGWDKPIRALVTRLHDYTQTQRDPEGWFAAQLAMFERAEPDQWQAWLLAGVNDWRNRWLPALAAMSGNPKAAEGAAALQSLPESPTREQCAGVLEQVLQLDAGWPAGKKTALRKPLAEVFEEAQFLASLTRRSGGADPLAEDWGWIRGQMGALLNLAREFSNEFAAAKRELGMVDFHDLEQHALRLLWDRATGQPTAIARQWREKLRFVFVDEYQDINDAQDAILKALSRDGPAANRFLVGDVKQSIYRFRLADPRIFLSYTETWRGGEKGIRTLPAFVVPPSGGSGEGARLDRLKAELQTLRGLVAGQPAAAAGAAGTTIPLVDNFRSGEAILNFVNALFGALMRREIGGVAYDDEARLRFGDPKNRAALATGPDRAPRVELLLRLHGAENSAGPEGAGESEPDTGNLEEAGKEARLVALRLRRLMADGQEVWDRDRQAMRPAEWRDLAVLLRSPSGKAEAFAREFARLGVPLVVARTGFYDSTEVADLLSLLQLLDNPLQDLPALAVLRSPLVGMSLAELAAIRLALPKGHVWSALQRYHKSQTGDSGWPKVERFLHRYTAWRRLARQVSLSRCLETVLDATHYADWLLTQSRGEQRHANVRRLVALAQQFDRFQRQGLYRFLRFVEAQQAAELGPETAAATGENAVALMSIHQSKGLEFPVVVLADLGKPFNLSDLRAEIILDGVYGLCPQIKPPQTGQRYPSLPYWLARQRQKQEFLGEELRLLYVAMTRARDTLILSGSCSETKFDARARADNSLHTASLLAARNSLEWIFAWAGTAAALGANELAETAPSSGENAWWRWRIFGDADLRDTTAGAQVAAGAESGGAVEDLDRVSLAALQKRLAWQYPQLNATRLPAKTSVTTLRRQLADDANEEAKPLFHQPRPRARGDAKLSAADKGTAHHQFLQFVALDRTASKEQLRQEAARLLSEQALSGDELASLDLDALAAFWQSDLGASIRSQSPHVRRELAFTARFTPQELGLAGAGESDHGEFIVVQGIADLAVLLPEEIWLVDFKTDEIHAAELSARVQRYLPQMQAYALALERVYRRPVRRAFLHFLALRQSVPVDHSATLGAAVKTDGDWPSG